MLTHDLQTLKLSLILSLPSNDEVIFSGKIAQAQLCSLLCNVLIPIGENQGHYTPSRCSARD